MDDARAAARRAFAAAGLTHEEWSNTAGFTYAGHVHDYDKVLICVSGQITLHLPDGDVALETGDRLDLPAGTSHAATVGESGVECMEAHY